MEGLIQVYTGEGKGKTTAAVGLAVRALGHGIPVLWASFLKPAEPKPGEILFLEGTPGLEILAAGIGVFGDAKRREVTASVRAAFALVRERLAVGDFGLACLDEINNAVHRGYLPLKDLLAFLDCRPPGVELVLTGRNAPPELLQRAHLVTRMEKVKHPLTTGIAARRGIEY